MPLQINYSGLEKAKNRDRKQRNRKRLKMTEDGRSVFLLEKLQKERIVKEQQENVPDLQCRQ